MCEGKKGPVLIEFKVDSSTKNMFIRKLFFNKITYSIISPTHTGVVPIGPLSVIAGSGG